MEEKKITILLTVFNRVEFTKKWLKFANNINVKFKIFLCDGGEDNELPLLIKKNTYPNLNIKYFKAKYYQNYEKFWEKFYESLNLIDTDYTYLAEDDDFIVPNNIIKSLVFLEINKDYASSGGIETHMQILSDKKKYFFLRPNTKTTGYNKHEIVSRINEALNNMYSNYNVLHRTKSLLKIFNYINQKNFTNLYITEFIFVLTSLIIGKCNRFNHIEYIKIDNINHSSSSDFGKKFKFSEIIKAKEYENENNFILKILKNETNINKKNFEDIKNNVQNYLENDKKYRLNEEILQNNKFNFRKFLKKSIGLENYNKIKSLSLKIFKKTLIRDLVFSDTDYKLNQDEIKLIQKIDEIY